MSSQRTRYHPLSDLAPEEIEASTQIIKAAYPPDATFDFRSSSLYEPERKDMVDFLRREHGGESQEGISPRPPREARVVYYLKSTVSATPKRISVCSFADRCLTMNSNVYSRALLISSTRD
jgi:Cu2+-containing amine oxidase